MFNRIVSIFVMAVVLCMGTYSDAVPIDLGSIRVNTPMYTAEGIDNLVSNVVAGIERDNITDGTNTIDAARNVYRIVGVGDEWELVSGRGVSGDPFWLVSSDKEGWYVPTADETGMLLLSGDFNAIELSGVVQVESNDDTAGVTRLIVSTNTWRRTNTGFQLIGRLALTNDVQNAFQLSTNAANNMITSATNGLASSASVDAKVAAATNELEGVGTGRQIIRGSNQYGPWDITVFNAQTAQMAQGDSDGRSIIDTYAEKSEVKDLHDQVNSLGDHYNELSGSVSGLDGTIGTHIRDTKNPHKVTAAQVGAYTRAEVDSKIESAVMPTDPTFSNAVLAVGLNIDTDSVAVLNEIAETFGGFPIEGTATTVGGILAALAAAVAWLRRNKADKATTLAGYGITDAATKVSLAPEYSPSSAYSVGEFVYHDGNIYQCRTAIADGGEEWNAAHWELRKLDDFFTESNSLLIGTIKANAWGDDEKMRAVFITFARMDDFTTVSDESDSFDIAITKLSQLLGEDVAA
jgi:hypothetical protein